MTARRFRVEIAGETFVGLAFGSDAELDAFLADRNISIDEAAPKRAKPPLEAKDETRRRGRPSFAAPIASAVAALGVQLDGCDGLAARARLVRSHIKAQTDDMADVPEQRTIEIYLAEHLLTREKVRGNSRGKSKGAMISTETGVPNDKARETKKRQR